MSDKNTDDLYAHIRSELEAINEAGLYKDERILLSPQGTDIFTAQGKVLNFCANNYLGLANHPTIIESAKNALEKAKFNTKIRAQNLSVDDWITLAKLL